MNIYFIDSIPRSFSKVMNLVFLTPFFFICYNALNTDRNYCKNAFMLVSFTKHKELAMTAQVWMFDVTISFTF